MLDGFFTKLQKRRQIKADNIHDIAERLGSGQDVKVEVVEQAMIDAGMSPDQLKALVEKYEARHKMRERVKECEKMDAEGKKLEAQLAAVNAEFERAEAKWQEQRAPLVARLRTIDQARADADYIRGQLKINSPNPAVENVRKELQAKHGNLMTRRYELTNQLTFARGQLELATKKQGLSASPENYDDDIRRWNIRIESYEKALAEVEAELPKAEAAEEKAMAEVATC